MFAADFMPFWAPEHVSVVEASATLPEAFVESEAIATPHVGPELVHAEYAVTFDGN